MTIKEINKLVVNLEAAVEGTVKLIETHISWVILSTKYVFKIKKPIKYSFLDYSTSEKRRFYCYKELILNRRLACNVYLEVAPIYLGKKGPRFSPATSEIIDHAVKMVRLDESKLMVNLLAKNKVTPDQMETLAKKIGDFHHKCEVVNEAFNCKSFDEKFSDIDSVSDIISLQLGEERDKLLKASFRQSSCFLQENTDLLNRRVKRGLQRDVHGDLHSKNIFLYKDPIIFDCIEFNDSYRQMDVLNEIAFCCMDLEANGKRDLSVHLLDHYLGVFDAIGTTQEMRIFIYFKAYRANVRAKVNALRARQASNADQLARYIQQTDKYLMLMKAYMKEL